MDFNTQDFYDPLWQHELWTPAQTLIVTGLQIQTMAYGNNLDLDPCGCVAHSDWTDPESREASDTSMAAGSSPEPQRWHCLQWYQELQTSIQTLAAIRARDPDKTLSSSSGPDNTMAPVAVCPSDRNMGTRCSLDPRHPCALWWHQGPQASQTLTVVGPWNQP